MGDRRIVTYEEPRNEFGPYWTLEIERSSSGDPTLLVTIRSKMFSSLDSRFNREMTIVVEDADEVLAPALSWARDRRKARDWERYGALGGDD